MRINSRYLCICERIAQDIEVTRPIIDTIVDDFMAEKPNKRQFIEMIDGSLGSASVLWAIYNRYRN